MAILVAAAIACGPAGGRAADRAGTESVFVLGSGARWQAMGRSGVALVDDANALFWNASRLGVVDQAELSLFRTRLFADGVLYHAGFFAYPTLDFGTFAVGYQRLDVGGIERRGTRNEYLGDFENTESNVLLGYGRPVAPGVQLGGAFRVIQQQVDEASDVGFGFDLGVSLERPVGGSDVHRLFLGANLRHVLEPSVRLATDEVVEPRSLKLGGAYAGTPPSGRFSWAVAADLDLPRDTAARFGAGGEVVYAQVLALRAGVDAGNPTFGVGATWRGISVDYALRSDDELSRNDRFSLALRLGRPVEQRRHERQAAREREVFDQLATLLRERETLERARTLAQADSAETAGDHETALKLYRRVLAFEPDPDVERRASAVEIAIGLEAARAQLESGQFAQAAASFQEIVEKWPSSSEAITGLERARAELAHSADRERQSNELLREAMTRLTGDDLVGAEAVLGELMRLEPRHALGHELQARVKSQRKTKGESELRRARSLVTAGDWDQAGRHLAEARRLLGESPEIALLTRDLNLASGRRRSSVSEDAAPKAPTSAIPATTPPRPLTPADRRQLDKQYQDGLQAFQVGDFDRAIKSWQAVWSVEPGFENVSEYLIKAYLYEGIASYSGGRYEHAAQMCRKVLEIDPKNEKARRYLERILEEKRELEQIEGGGR